jgi:hypothetical protein
VFRVRTKVNKRTGEVREVVKRRKVRRAVRCRLRTNGYVVVNDGPAVGLMLAGALRT